MGAISGIYNFGIPCDVERAELLRINAVQRHRGPQHFGIHLDGRIGLVNRRLGIVAAEGGQQPMSAADSSIWISYAGEIFNRDLLRQELQSCGHEFRTSSDTEVALAAYERFGNSFVERLRGQFAIAIWDSSLHQLLLARDPLGIAPLHYALHDGCIVFASEAKGVLQHHAIETRIDPGALVDTLLCGAVFDGGTLFAQVRRLAPGTYLTVTPHAIETSTYWRLPVAKPTERGDGTVTDIERIEQVRHLLENAVRSQRTGNVAWGIMLSGGVDSTTLTALARAQTTRPIQTFTIDFPDPWRASDCDAHYASLVADRLQTNHRLFLTKPHEYFECLDQLAYRLERPYNKAVATAYLLYRQLAEHTTYVMSGEGMDELLAGYAGARGLGMEHVPGNGNARDRRAAHMPWAPEFAVMNQLLSAEFREVTRPLERLRDRMDAAVAECADADPLSQTLYLYGKYFLPELIELHDLASFAAGVETRFPFLDQEFVAYVTALPARWKLRSGQGKYIVRRAVADLLPREVAERRKTHLPIPHDPISFRAHLEMAEDLLLSPVARTSAYLDQASLRDFILRTNRFADCDALAVWQVTMSLITLELVCRSFQV